MALISVTISGNAGPLRKELGQADSMLGKFGKAAGVAVAAAGTAITAIAGASVKAFAGFDSAITQSVAIMSGVTEDLRKQMETVARSVAKDLGMSATESAKSFFYLASAGLDAEQSMAALPQVAKFAKAGMFDMALATDLATDAQSALGLASKDASANLTNLTRVTDVLVKANTLANATVQQFSEALTNKAGAAMKSVGMDVEAGVAVLAAFADQGIKGAEAGTQFSIVMRDLQTKALDNASAFEQFGIAVFDNTGEMNNMGTIIAQIEDALNGMSDAETKATLATLGFTDKSIAALLALVGTSEKIQKYESDLRSAGGTTEEIANNQLKSFAEQLNLIKTQVVDVGISIGQFLAPIILEIAKRFGALVERASELGSKVMPTVRNAIDRIVEVIRNIAIPVLGFFRDTFDRVRIVVDDNAEAIGNIRRFFGDLVTFIRDKVAPIMANVLGKTFSYLSSTVIPDLVNAILKVTGALASVGSFVLQLAGGVLDAFEAIVNGVINSVNFIIRLMNRIPGVNIDEIPGASFGLPSLGGAASKPIAGFIGSVDRLASPSMATPSTPSLNLPGGGGTGGSTSSSGGGTSRGGARGGLGGFNTATGGLTLSNLADYGTLESARLADIALLDVQPPVNITVNTVTADENLPTMIVDALQRYNLIYGPAEIEVAI